MWLQKSSKEVGVRGWSEVFGEEFGTQEFVGSAKYFDRPLYYTFRIAQSAAKVNTCAHSEGEKHLMLHIDHTPEMGYTHHILGISHLDHLIWSLLE